MSDVTDWLDTRDGQAWLNHRHHRIMDYLGISPVFASVKEDPAELILMSVAYTPDWESAVIGFYSGEEMTSITVDPAITDLPSPA